MWLGSKFTSLSDSLFRSLFRFLFRYDIFISYARRDGKEYALKLRDQLKQLDFSCFLDVDELPAGNSLNSTLKRSIRRSATLVVVGTERATKSRYVELEVGEFAGTGRAVIPIDIEGTLAGAPWGVLKERDLVWIDEARAALERGVPSPNVADSIDKLFKYTRRNSRVRAQVFATFILFVLLAAGGSLGIWQQKRTADAASADAARQKVEASNQKTAAEEASRRAETAKAEAVQAQADAKVAQDDAERSQAKATTAEKAALDATKEAKRQEALALSNAEAAKRQQRIAEERTNYVRAQQMAVQADVDVDRGDNLERSVLLSVESLKRAWTPDGYVAWAKGMGLLPHADEVKFADREEKVTAVAYSPDGRFFAQGTGEGVVTFFRTDGTAQPVKKSIQSGGAIKVVAFGEGWAAAASTNEFVMWDSKEFNEIRSSKTLSGFHGQSIAFSPDGRYVATGGPVHNQPLRVYDTVSSRTVIQERLEHVDYVMSVAFSPGGKWLAVACIYKKYEEKNDDAASGARKNAVEIVSPQDKPSVGRVMFWDVSAFEKGEEAAHTPSGWFDEEGYIHSVAFGPKGEHLATEDEKGVVRVWTISDDNGRLRLKRVEPKDERTGGGIDFQHYGQTTLVFSPDESYIATVPDKSTARLWEVGSRREVSRILHEEAVESIAFSPDNRFATADSGGVKFWKTEFGSEAGRVVSANTTNGDGVTDIAVSPGGEWLVTAGDDGARLLSTNDWSPVKTLDGTKPVSKVTFSEDGRWLVAAGQGTATVFGTKPWGAGREILHAGPDSSTVPVVGFSPNGKWLVAASYNLVRLFGVGSWQEIRALPQENAVDRMAFSPDGQWLAVFVKGINHGEHVIKPNEIHIWNTSDWTPAACTDNSPRPDDDTQTPQRDVCADVKAAGREIALSEVLRWKETPGHDPLKETPGLRPGEYVSPDGRWSVENSNGVLLRFNEGKNERPIATLMYGAWTFTPDSRWLLIYGGGAVGLWPLERAAMIDAACARLRRRDLTDNERKDYIADGGTQPTCPATH